MTFKKNIIERVDFQKKHNGNWTSLMIKCFNDKIKKDIGDYYYKKWTLNEV